MSTREQLVEDEDHLALGLRLNLENAGYQVELSRSGAAALDHIRSAKFDLVILVIMLPGELDGYAVGMAIQAITEARLTVPEDVREISL